MSSYRRQSKSSVSLFPFLAVLVCAMGALIFLLIVTTRRIRLQAIALAYETQLEQTHQAEPNPKIPHEDALWDPLDLFMPDERMMADEPKPSAAQKPVGASEVEETLASEDVVSTTETPEMPSQEELQAEWEQIVAELAAKREEWFKRLTSQESAVEAARETKAATEATLHEKQTKLQTTYNELRENRQIGDSLRNEIASLQEQITQLQQQVIWTRQQKLAARSKFTFIPYDGKSGTTRRPLLIECKGDSVTFLPENVRISREELNGFTVKYNPLLAGVQTLVDFWTAWNRVHPEDGLEEKPYVLLIVRPSGALLFYVARAILSQLDIPYGYELIDDDWELALPDPDPRAVAACRDAVNRVLAERDHLLAFLAENRSQRQDQIRMDDLTPHPDHSSTAARGANNSAHTRRTVPNRALRTKRGPSSNAARTSSAQNLHRGEQPRGQAFPQQSLAHGVTSADDATALSASQAGKANSTSSNDSSSSVSRAPWTKPPHWGREPNPRLAQSRSEVDRDRSTEREANGSTQKGFGQRSANVVTRASGSMTNSSNGVPHGLNFDNPSRKKMDKLRAETTRQGIDWGLRRGSATIGLERRLTIDVQIDRIIVDHDSIVPIIESQSTDELFQQVRMAMEQATRVWPDAPRSFYWIPAIHFVVRPGGIQYYERLRLRLSEQGLVTTAQFPFVEQTANQLPEIRHESTYQ